ncbi:MAG: MFS transporter [Alicyclobacillaceae bacterium]|jgi:DHA1 family multidrug resistance protein B-like MFS transporter|nr:MFS transporter [Alicyclobacillaceae bacterium]
MQFGRLHRNIRIRVFVFFAFGIAQATTQPFMTIYFAKHFGAGLTGILLAAGLILALFSSAYGGYVADGIGRRRILLYAEATFFLTYLAMAVANSPWYHSAVITFVAYIIGNLCWGIYGPVDDAMILDVTDSDSRRYVFSLFYWMMNLTMAIGSSIGALFFNVDRFLLFAVMAIVVLGTWFITYFFIAETYHPPKTTERGKGVGGTRLNLWQSYRRIAMDRPFLIYLLAGTLAATVESELPNYIGVHLADTVHPYALHLLKWIVPVDGISMVGFLQTENTVLVVLLASFAVKLAQKLPDKTTLLFGVGLNALGFALQCVFSAPLALALAMAVATFGEVLAVPVRQSYMGDLAPLEGRTSYLAVTSMTWGMGRVLASLSVTIGAHVPAFGVASLLVLFGAISYLGYARVAPVASERRKLTDVSSGV